MISPHPLHPQQAHLPPQGRRSCTALLTGIARAVRINVPVRLGILTTTALARGRAVACLEALLHRSARVPAQRSRHAVKPFRVGACDGREWILRCGDGHAVAWLQLHAALAIKGTVGGGARVARHRHAEEHRVGEDHGPERERMGADGGEKDGGDVRVDKRAASGEGVGC